MVFLVSSVGGRVSADRTHPHGHPEDNQPPCQERAYQIPSQRRPRPTRLSRFSDILPRAVRAALLPIRHVARRLHATPSPAVILSAMLLAWLVPGLVPTSRGEEPKPPDLPQALAVFAELEAWLRELDVPGSPSPTDRGWEGALIVIRLDGRILGRGERLVLPGDATAGSVTAAARDAMQAVRSFVQRGDPTLREERRRLIAQQASISLELAQRVTPIRPGSWLDLDRTTSPGLAGLGARAGQRVEATFPSSMLSQRITPSASLQSAIARATGDPALAVPGIPESEPGALSQRLGLSYYRFEATQLVRERAGMGPFVLHRGQTLVEPASITREALVSLESRIASHLAGRLGTREISPGDTGPARDTSDPRASTRAQRALAAIALARFARRAGDMPAPIASAIDGVAHECAAPDPSDSAFDPLDAALACVVLADAPASAERRAAAERLGARLRAMLDPGEGNEPAISASARALAAYAIVHLDEARSPASHALVRSVYRASAPEDLLQHMPWLLWAELDLAGTDREIPSAALLTETRDRVRKLQADAPGIDDRDFEGGFLLTPGQPYPTWHSARPAATLASMLADPRLATPSDDPRALADVLRAARFVAQLTTDEPTSVMYAHPALARGGVRSAGWDPREPIDASSFGLIAITESIRALDAAADRQTINHHKP